MLCCVVAGIVSINSLVTKCDGIRPSCCVKFLVRFNFSCILINKEFKLLFPVLSVKSVI